VKCLGSNLTITYII